MKPGDHECAASGCGAIIESQEVFCHEHYAPLPREIKSELGETWRRARRDPEAYREARQAAIDWLSLHFNPNQGRLF